MNVKTFFRRYPEEIFLFLAAFFIRFPFFFRDYIDKDESTFILMGQSIVDGHLPYDHLWDLKPPLLFYFFALIEKLFPHSFVAIRFCGVIIIFLSAILLMKIAKQAKLKNGFLISLGYVVLSSEFGSLQGVMSEHFAVLFLLLGLLFFLKKRGTHYFIAGIAFGCAILCKLNYAYAIAALLLLHFVNDRKKTGWKGIMNFLVVFVPGLLIPFALIAVPFITLGKMRLFLNSVFLAPLKYSRALNYSLIYKLTNTWWIIALTVFIIYLSVKFAKKENREVVFACIAILIGTVYTFFSSGIVNGHYLVQVYPIFLILLFGVLAPKPIHFKLNIAAIVILVLSIESVAEYVRLIKATQNPTKYRPTFEVIRELKRRKLDEDKIFFADYHVGYWLLDQYPLTKSTTHPSNLARPYLFPYYNDSRETSLDELKYIMEGIKPKVIVSGSDDLNFFPDNSPENLYFKQSLEEDFEIIFKDTLERIYIWEREPG